MANSSFDRLKELNLSQDEVNRIGEALKKEEFRKLLIDYVEEIQDPINRQKYEEEVKQIEKERGQEVTFLHPTAGYVIKTSINGSHKSFINICSNENIHKPCSTPTVKDGAKGLQWSLPHSLSPPHEDIDNKGIRCQVYDVLFHPDTLHLASKNQEFHSMVNNVALTAIENNFNVNLDKKNLKFPKITYKGMKRASLMRKPSKDKPVEHTAEEQEIYNKIYAEIDSKRNLTSPTKTIKKNRRNSSEDNSVYTTPKYIIKHRSHLEMQEFTEHKNAKINAAIPKELIVEINLPLLKSSSDMDLDVTEKTLQVVSEKPAKYKLNLTLPYSVNEASGNAKFDKDLKKLVITLPVKKKFELEVDSGVESCVEENDLNRPNSPESDGNLDDDNKPIISDFNRTFPSDTFLNPNDLYNLPESTCNIFNNTVAFTFNVKNVDESTVCKITSSESSLVKVKFTSVSSSYYPTCYAFYVKFPQHEIIEENVNIETWDNNVILQIPLKASEKQFESYLCGTNEDNLFEKFIQEPAIITKAFENSEQSKNVLTEKENLKDTSKEVYKYIKPKSSAIDILALSYESSGDELSSSSFSPRKSKGILKRMSSNRAKLGRSVSESSLDDFLYSSFENYHGSIECVPEDAQEEEEEGMASSLKKTVRFSDVVSKQLFRSNSSILGQKKKNQRKSRNKKRAHERRYSESEVSDTESRREGDNQTNNNCDQTENESKIEISVSDKKDEGDIFHLEIND